jgi:hypothetical protein
VKNFAVKHGYAEVSGKGNRPAEKNYEKNHPQGISVITGLPEICGNIISAFI